MNSKLGNRIALSRIIWRVRTRSPLNQRLMGVLVAKQLGRAKDFSKMTVSHWESGTSEPDSATLAAIATLAGVDPGWLAFGDASSAPDPFERMDPLTRRMVEGEMSVDEKYGGSGFRSAELDAFEASAKRSERHHRRMKAFERRRKEIAAMPEGRNKIRAMERLARGGRRTQEDE